MEIDMSFQAMTWAVSQECENAGQKLVLIMLANHTNGHTGQCNPSHKLLADECSMGISTLKRHLQGLADKGYIDVLAVIQDGVNLPNHYRLKLEGVGPNRAGGSVQIGLVVGPNRTEGGSKLGRGVGPNRATNQEHINQEDEPGTETVRRQAIACPPDVDQQVWADWVQLRKTKRATVTQTVVDGARKEAEKADMSLSEFLAVWCRRGSQGLEAAWLKPNEKPAEKYSWLKSDDKPPIAKKYGWLRPDSEVVDME
jgi:hypothetical protein